MSDPSGPDDPDEPRGAGSGPGPRSGDREPVGSVGEEAAKLFGALSGWAREQGQDYAGTAAGAAGSFAHALHEVNEHVATGSADCRYCPVCQVIHAVRQTSPEVRAHLGTAASSLMHAAAALMATDPAARSTAVEKIDLDVEGDETGWED